MYVKLAQPTPHAWIEVLCTAPTAQAEAVADFLYTLTGFGVETRELDTVPPSVEVRGWLAAGGDLASQKAALERLADSLREACRPDEEVRLRFQELANQNWAENWKQYFRPRLVTKTLIVAPPWEPVTPEPWQQVLLIDPGQAFGTGQHESTQLCLRRLEELAEKGEMPGRLLDVGCGTGILAMAALIFGAESALGIDIDPACIEAARHNAGLNGLEGRLEAVDTPLERVTERFPLILANLTAKDLVELCDQIVARLLPGGMVILAGLLTGQAAQVRQAFEARGMAFLEQDSLTGWSCLVLV